MKKLLLLLLFSFSIVLAQDTDNDLVPNELDKCLDTPDGVFVDKDGCTKQIKRTVYFSHGLYSINKEEQQTINDIKILVKEGFGYKIFIEGHTDSIADAQVNMRLSEQRAIVIQDILLTTNIEKSRIEIKWYGETMPISSNITKTSRAKNRRVTITFK